MSLVLRGPQYWAGGGGCLQSKAQGFPDGGLTCVRPLHLCVSCTAHFLMAQAWEKHTEICCFLFSQATTGIHRIGCRPFLCQIYRNSPIMRLSMSRHPCTQPIQILSTQTITLEVTTSKVIFRPHRKTSPRLTSCHRCPPSSVISSNPYTLPETCLLQVVWALPRETGSGST